MHLSEYVAVAEGQTLVQQLQTSTAHHTHPKKKVNKLLYAGKEKKYGDAMMCKTQMTGSLS